jgi:hypothetical protein
MYPRITWQPVHKIKSIVRLRPQSSCHFAQQPSARVSQTLRPSYLSHMTTDATYADQYWHLHSSDYRYTLIYAHTTSRTLPICDVSIGSLTLSTPEAGEFVELIMIYVQYYERYHKIFGRLIILLDEHRENIIKHG